MTYTITDQSLLSLTSLVFPVGLDAPTGQTRVLHALVRSVRGVYVLLDYYAK